MALVNLGARISLNSSSETTQGTTDQSSPSEHVLPSTSIIPETRQTQRVENECLILGQPGGTCERVTAPRGKAGPDVGSRRVAPLVAAEW